VQNLSYGNEFDLQADKRARKFISITMAVQQDSVSNRDKANTEIAYCDIPREYKKKN